MRRYLGIRCAPRRGEIDCPVYVVDGNARLRPLPHLVHHSPTGFEWGYSGSGPADLAIAILADAAPDLVTAQASRKPPVPTHFYQQFKYDVISRLPYPGWLIGRAAVLAWVRAARAGLRDSDVRAGLVAVDPLLVPLGPGPAICPACRDDREVACPRDVDAACHHCGQAFCAHHILPHLAEAHCVDAEWRGHLRAEAGGKP